MQTKVVKFGGSSLCDADHFRQAASIITGEGSRRYVVPSAPGKRRDGDSKVTDMLYECFEASERGEDTSSVIGEIFARYTDIIAGLGLDLSLEDEFDYIKNALAHYPGRDYAASRGEYLCGIILAKYLGYDFIDAAEVVFFREDGSFDSERTNEVLRARLRQHRRAVIPGFYGSMPNGTIKTFSRSGSDVTGAIVARAAEADLYENWTDVSGIKIADPRIISDSETIRVVTYRELRELSYMGASVFHEDAIFPVRFAGIPINIRNTNDPGDPGTMIVSQAHEEASDSETGVITGIAGKRGFSVITIEKDMMNSEIGFGRRVLEALETHGISFEHLPSGIDTMSVIINSGELTPGVKESLLNAICRAVNPESVSIEDGLALVAVVGRGMVKAKGTAAKIFGAAAGASVNIRMIDQGSSEYNIIIGVDECDFETAVRAIYAAFI